MILELAILTASLPQDNNPGPSTNISETAAVQLWLPNVSPDARSNFPVRLGANYDKLRKLRNVVGRRMVAPDMDHKPGVTVKDMGEKIVQAVKSQPELSNIDWETPLGQFLVANGIVDWIRAHIPYNKMLEPGKIGAVKGLDATQEQKLRNQFYHSSTLLQKRELCAVCAGFSRLAGDLAKAVGVPLYNVSGYTRGQLRVAGTYTDVRANHSWNVLVLELTDGGRLVLPTDPTQARVEISRARSLSFDWYSGYSFPMTNLEIAFFHYAQYPFNVLDKAPIELDSIQTVMLTRTRWAEMGTIRVFERMRGRLLEPSVAATIDKMPDFD